MTLQDAVTAYQAYLEGHRADPDNETLYRDLLKARETMVVAWLRHTVGQTA